ncbi:(2Fe-2S)-binding protein [Pantoea coffeiphila]|uniref:(2Fe-2S)-binding protein n=1 Tax=Pantoea coffeiphila TaxID=1465635 RepID=UPI001961BBB7|nr:(2Fe-2S)-binding protein [Pantoea coffeiphila]MBM7343979.1 nicotinate dehydrogenase subunit A [Pantoea coffeiphila]
MHFTLNGKRVEIDDALSDTPLLYILRNDFQLNGPKYGCGIGECGACTIHIDGLAARSCSIPAASAAGKSIVTLEGLVEGTQLHPVQQGFIDEQAAQCGYCTNGMIMTLVALFTRQPDASEQQIKNELAFNLCRCGTHLEILRAAEKARQIIAGGQQP